MPGSSKHLPVKLSYKFVASHVKVLLSTSEADQRLSKVSILIVTVLNQNLFRKRHFLKDVKSPFLNILGNLVTTCTDKLPFPMILGLN